MNLQSESDSEPPTEPRPLRRFVYDRPWMYPKQLAATFYPTDSTGTPARYGLTEAGTKTGKTVSHSAWLFEQAFRGPRNSNFWWVAPVSGQASMVYRRMIVGIPKRLIASTHEGLKIELIGRRSIWFKSADNPDSLYGDDVFAAVMDEASRTKEEAFHAVRSTLTATRGPFRAIGNVKGRKNWFYQMCRRAEQGAPNLGYSRIVAQDAVDAGILASEEIEDARRHLPAQVFRELYLAEPSDDGGNPFGLKHIESCFGPLSTKLVSFWGWDLAKSEDWTVGCGLDDGGQLAEFHRFRAPWPETTETIRRVVGQTSPALVDSTGVGDPILDSLQKGSSNFEGFKFSLQSKQKIMEGLAVTVQSRNTQFPPSERRPAIDSPANLANEMEEFQYEYTRTGVRYSAPPGYHDDCVCSMALADECRRTRGDLSTWAKLGSM